MTRFLEKEQKTQVNSNLIGVQVRPEVVPPTYEVSELTADTGINLFGCTYTSNDDVPMLYANYGQGDEIWAYTGTKEEYGGTVYKIWHCIYGASAAAGIDLLTNDNDSITDQTQFYFYEQNPENPRVVAVFISDYMLNYGGDLMHFDPNGLYWYVTDDSFVQSVLNDNPECELVDGFFKSRETGGYLGKFTGTTTYTSNSLNFTYSGDDNGYSVWKMDYYSGADLYLYSTIRNPYVGYNLISNMNGSEAYVSPVTDVSKVEVNPGYTESVDCSVEYSVDGETWTAWEKNLTDDNNVIANIPRYMYLKFGQDVEITEE